LLSREVGAIDQVLVHADCTVIFAPAPEQAAEGIVQLDGFGVHLDDLDESLDSFVGLLVEEEIEPLEVGPGQRPRLG